MNSESNQALILAMIDRAEQEENGLEDDLDYLIGLLDAPEELKKEEKSFTHNKMISPFRNK